MPDEPASGAEHSAAGALAARLLAERLAELVGLNHEAETRQILDLATRDVTADSATSRAEGESRRSVIGSNVE